MVSDGKQQVSKEVLTDQQKKKLAKQNLERERSSLATQDAEWSHEPSAFNHLPPHEKPFSIQPFEHVRQRVPFKMSDEDRKRRQIWVESQELTEREPVRVPELEYMIYNPIRRLYRLPTDRLFQTLAPIVGEHRVPLFRYAVPKFFLGWVGACILWYNIKYYTPSWEEKKGFTTVFSNPRILPDEEKLKEMSKWDYADRGFQARTVARGSEYAY